MKTLLCVRARTCENSRLPLVNAPAQTFSLVRWTLKEMLWAHLRLVAAATTSTSICFTRICARRVFLSTWHFRAKREEEREGESKMIMRMWKMWIKSSSSSSSRSRDSGDNRVCVYIKFISSVQLWGWYAAWYLFPCSKSAKVLVTGSSILFNITFFL